MIKTTAKLSILFLLIAITTCYYEREIHEELEICFVRGGNIWIMDMDGSNQRRITDSTEDSSPSWSPDGKKILFHTTRNGPYEIYIIDSDGQNLQKFASGGIDSRLFPTWSSDGNKTVFIGVIGVQEFIFLANNKGNILKNFGFIFSIYFATISPDSNYIYFSDALTTPNLYILDLKTNNYTQLSLSGYPTFSVSPDGSTLACTHEDSGYIHLWHKDTGLVAPFVAGNNPCWTPDGDSIVYVNIAGNICIIKTDGSYQKELTTGGAYDSPCVKWKPR